MESTYTQPKYDTKFNVQIKQPNTKKSVNENGEIEYKKIDNGGAKVGTGTRRRSVPFESETNLLNLMKRDGVTISKEEAPLNFEFNDIKRQIQERQNPGLFVTLKEIEDLLKNNKSNNELANQELCMGEECDIPHLLSKSHSFSLNLLEEGNIDEGEGLRLPKKTNSYEEIKNQLAEEANMKKSRLKTIASSWMKSVCKLFGYDDLILVTNGRAALRVVFDDLAVSSTDFDAAKLLKDLYKLIKLFNPEKDVIVGSTISFFKEGYKYNNEMIYPMSAVLLGGSIKKVELMYKLFQSDEFGNLMEVLEGKFLNRQKHMYWTEMYYTLRYISEIIGNLCYRDLKSGSHNACQKKLGFKTVAEAPKLLPLSVKAILDFDGYDDKKDKTINKNAWRTAYDMAWDLAFSDKLKNIAMQDAIANMKNKKIKKAKKKH